MLSLRSKEILIHHHQHPDSIVDFLLSSRGMQRVDIMENTLHDPFLMPDMHQAVQRILEAKKKKERVMIFGDYDVDGVSSTATLFLFLRDELGIDVSYRLPHRVKDGYGIKNYHIEDIVATGSKLLITVDCGTKDIEPVKRAYEGGLDVIITDHHSCPALLPECVAVVNPRRLDSHYPFSGLSGSGVVWKLIHALLLTIMNPSGGTHHKSIPDILMKYVDIVSLGTVADCMPMLDENRTIVRHGLLQSQNSYHAFFQIFSGILQRPIVTEEDIGFFVGPMLNAGGRITTPYQSISTLLSGSENAYVRIQELMNVNETRKGLSRQAYEKALRDLDMTASFIVYCDETLEHGIIGLVAARLSELSHRPVGVFTRDGDNYVGSFRAPPGIDLVKILDSVSDAMLRYGGHAGAAGCTVAESMFGPLRDALLVSMDTLYDVRKFSPLLEIDAILDQHKITPHMVQEIESLRPFGPGFASPIFMLSDVENIFSPLGKTGQHYKWDSTLSPGCDIIGFNFEDISEKLLATPRVHLVGKLSTRTWRDTVSVQFQVIDVIKA